MESLCRQIDRWIHKQSPCYRKRRRGVLQKPNLCAEILEDRIVLTVVTMTAYEQLLLELVNRARSDPSGEAARYGIDLNEGLTPGTISATPKQPLAPNQILVDVAGAHSQDMLDQDYFDHTGKDGREPHERATDAGYDWLAFAENIAWGGVTPPSFPIDQTQHVYERHQGLFESPGHRVNLLGETYQEVGLGVRYGYYTDYEGDGRTYNASMVTENFGNPPGTRSSLGLSSQTRRTVRTVTTTSTRSANRSAAARSQPCSTARRQLTRLKSGLPVVIRFSFRAVRTQSLRPGETSTTLMLSTTS